MKPSRPLFIVLEGSDGAGTTTQAAKLSAWLSGRGQPHITTREPSAGAIGTLLREALRKRPAGENGLVLPAAAMALLFAADRVDHVTREIEPALQNGQHVVCDRYYHSTIAYQGDACGFGWVRDLHRFAPRPDVTFLLLAPVEAAMKRVHARGGEREIYETSEIQAQVITNYRRMRELLPGDKIVEIDASAGMDEVFQPIAAELERMGL